MFNYYHLIKLPWKVLIKIPIKITSKNRNKIPNLIIKILELITKAKVKVLK